MSNLEIKLDDGIYELTYNIKAHEWLESERGLNKPVMALAHELHNGNNGLKLIEIAAIVYAGLYGGGYTGVSLQRIKEKIFNEGYLNYINICAEALGEFLAVDKTKEEAVERPEEKKS